MYTNNNIPQKRYYKPGNYQTSGTNYTTSGNYMPTTTVYHDGDRFIGGGFWGPLLLGGVGGYLIGGANNNGFGNNNQGPIPVYFPPQGMPYPYPPYSNTNIYY